MTIVKCLRTYKKLPIADRLLFAQGVRDGVYGNPIPFTTPPILQADFEAFITEFIAKRALYENGGSAQKPAWEYANTNLVDALDTTAEYVDTLVNGSENVVILAGYRPSKSTKSSIPKPTKITGVKLTRSDVSGNLIADCDPQDGVTTYVCILTKGAPLPDDVIITQNGQIIIPDTAPSADGTATDGPTGIYVDFNQYRKKEFAALTTLQTYYCVFFGINAGGVGAMSEPVSIICV